ncbi:hypothetical protein SAMN05660420_01476 [Desulfuromusa kysingii]|uniref:Uncharacterized protein n=1 Tax=Desulfuromusa kysingii TaxID=37625 RepID=A0A1H3Z103_9BACT|nr:hypothetical protein [Desulfuromusa kysingii]SEA17346.1 hypothetical protein SAMN05660420_01476 [Desulfuromusa kysingii]
MTRFIVVIVCAIALFLPQTTFAKSKIEQAKDYVTIGEKSSAYQLLREAILEDPMDGDTHYDAGLVFAEIGYIGDFDKAMGNACKLKSSYCPKIGDVYFSQGFSRLAQGSTGAAKSAFENVFQYQPAKKTQVLNRLFEIGKRHLSFNKIQKANVYFSLLTQFDNSYRSQIAASSFEIGKNASPPLTYEAYALANSYSSQFKKQSGDDLASLAKNDSFSEDMRAKLKREAGKYLTDAQMAEHFPPDFIELAPDEDYSFPNLNKGEETNIWIRSPYGVNTILSITSNNFYKIKTRDGKKFNTLKGEKMPDNKYRDFKFIALADNLKLTARFKRK